MSTRFSEILQEYMRLNLSTVIDFDKFNQYSIVHHSSTIEGSTLSVIETQLLIEQGTTPKGKPLAHSQMVIDHFKALQYILESSKSKVPITPLFIQEINGKVMKSTGSSYNTPLGTVEASKGEFRKGNVTAGGSYFVGFDKVPKLVDELCKAIQQKQLSLNTIEEKLQLSFDAHFDLVTIHPFYDGNGRTSRLLMNYIQHLSGLPMAIVHQEDKAEYYQTLIDTRKSENIHIFRDFMARQMEKQMLSEIAQYKDIQRPNNLGRFYSLILF